MSALAKKIETRTVFRQEDLAFAKEYAMSAAKSGNAVFLRSLLEVAPEMVHAKDALGNTLLHYAVAANPETVQVLCRFGADPLTKNNTTSACDAVQRLEELRAGDFFRGREHIYAAILGHLKLACVVG